MDSLEYRILLEAIEENKLKQKENADNHFKNEKKYKFLNTHLNTFAIVSLLLYIAFMIALFTDYTLIAGLIIFPLTLSIVLVITSQIVHRKLINDLTRHQDYIVKIADMQALAHIIDTNFENRKRMEEINDLLKQTKMMKEDYDER